ncbi:MAG TPA: phosphoglycerate mutase [Methylocystis sp.]|nr:phosphoglycerate mutase [Methylocystis sp.]
MRRGKLGFEIAAALIFKAAALALLFFAFFAGAHRMRVTPENAVAALTRGAPAHQ